MILAPKIYYFPEKNWNKCRRLTYEDKIRSEMDCPLGMGTDQKYVSMVEFFSRENLEIEQRTLLLVKNAIRPANPPPTKRFSNHDRGRTIQQTYRSSGRPIVFSQPPLPLESKAEILTNSNLCCHCLTSTEVEHFFKNIVDYVSFKMTLHPNHLNHEPEETSIQMQSRNTQQKESTILINNKYCPNKCQMEWQDHIWWHQI